MFYIGTAFFRGNDYLVEELHGEDKIVGKYCLTFEIGNCKPRLFVMSIKEEGSGIQRPTIFDSLEDVRAFANEIHFPQYNLKLTKITHTIYVDNQTFVDYGAYYLRKSMIVVPNRKSSENSLIAKLKKKDEEREEFFKWKQKKEEL